MAPSRVARHPFLLAAAIGLVAGALVASVFVFERLANGPRPKEWNYAEKQADGRTITIHYYTVVCDELADLNTSSGAGGREVVVTLRIRRASDCKLSWPWSTQSVAASLTKNSLSVTMPYPVAHRRVRDGACGCEHPVGD